jgi:hypothetical protein
MQSRARDKEFFAIFVEKDFQIHKIDQEENMKQIIFGSLAIVFFVVFAGVAGADQKNYVWTYDYSSLAKDSAEIEFYQTAVTRDRKVSGRSDWQQQIELEYGITDHLDAALYEMYERPAEGTFDYAGYKFRLRYRIAEKNQLPLDVVLYAEHQETLLNRMPLRES